MSSYDFFWFSYDFLTLSWQERGIHAIQTGPPRPPRQATGPPRQGAGMGVGMLRGFENQQKIILISRKQYESAENNTNNNSQVLIS